MKCLLKLFTFYQKGFPAFALMVGSCEESQLNYLFNKGNAAVTLVESDSLIKQDGLEIVSCHNNQDPLLHLAIPNFM